jgi:hypothetical protein
MFEKVDRGVAGYRQTLLISKQNTQSQFPDPKSV